MLASRRFLACCFFLQGVATSLATPFLVERGNSKHLKCTNAPTVVAGYYLDPVKAIPPSSASATCQAQFEYLYCVPGTETYIFFGTIKPSVGANASAYAATLKSVVAYIDEQIGSFGDTPIQGGLEYFTTQDTDIQTYVEEANKHHLTLGVAAVALKGLNAWMADDANGYSDAMFQINDGSNWVGNGYIGVVNENNNCVFANAYIPNTPCTATDPEGSVFGYKGGKIC